VLSEPPGSFSDLKPSKPAEEVSEHPGVYSFRTIDEAEPFLGALRKVLSGERTAKLRLFSHTSKDALAIVVASYDPRRCTEDFVDAKTMYDSRYNRKVKQNIWEPQVTPADTV
jgi:hypothetical protein